MPAIAYEIEEFEVPAQKYTFLRACLKFLQPIISQQLKTNTDLRTLGYCVVFLVNHVLIKIPTRAFKSIQEKVSADQSWLKSRLSVCSSLVANRGKCSDDPQ